MKKIVLSLAVLLFSICSQAQPPEGNAAPGDVYGAKVNVKGAIPLADLATKLESGSTAADAKKSKAEIDAITEPKKEISILASGIVVIQ